MNLVYIRKEANISDILISSIKHGNENISNFLLEIINLTPEIINKNDLIHSAIRNKMKMIVIKFLSLGIDLKKIDYYGCDPLTEVVIDNNSDFLDLILDAQQNWTFAEVKRSIRNCINMPNRNHLLKKILNRIKLDENNLDEINKGVNEILNDIYEMTFNTSAVYLLISYEIDINNGCPNYIIEKYRNRELTKKHFVLTIAKRDYKLLEKFVDLGLNPYDLYITNFLTNIEYNENNEYKVYTYNRIEEKNTDKILSFIAYLQNKFTFKEIILSAFILQQTYFHSFLFEGIYDPRLLIIIESFLAFDWQNEL